MGANRVRATVIFGVLGLLALAAAGWFFVLAPRLNQAADLSSQADQVEFSTLQLTGRYNQTLDLARAAPDAAAEAQVLFSRMPDQAQLPDVLAQITDAASRAGIKPTGIPVIETSVPRTVVTTTTEAVPADGSNAANLGASLAQMDITVTVVGTRPQLMKFLDNLEALDRALLLTTEGLSATTEAGVPSNSESLNVTGSMFVLQSELPDLVANVQKVLRDASLTADGATAVGAGSTPAG